MEPRVDRPPGSTSIEGPCPRCGRFLKAMHTVSQYGRPSVALLECAHCRYTCQTVVSGLWPDEAFPRTRSSAR
jgi:transcription elongation factor Elf1